MQSAIFANEEKYSHLPVVYLLRLPKMTIGDKVYYPLYKFGITKNITERLRTHLKNLNFTGIIYVKTFDSIEDAGCVETNIKRTAEKYGERVNLLSNTELLKTHDINKYIEIINSYDV